ncbi:MAG: hypothetical protein KA319_13835 [Ferruginibacter sp.]|nr:hypothetical protein [Ferruginibacter sp.]
MKKINLLLLLSLSFICTIAQPPRRDTIVGGGGGEWTPWHLQATRVPILLTPTNATAVAPTQKVCFDKKIFAKGSANGRVLDMYIYINTDKGYVGILSGREGTLGDGDIDINNSRFNFMLYTKKGNFFNYYNRKKKDVLKHYVTTGNSQQHLLQQTVTGSNDQIYKKTVRNIYCGDKFKTWSYKADGDAPVYHVFGRTYPNSLKWKDFLGHSGIGYVYTDAGIYIVCEMEKESFFTEMRSFDDVNICFDPAEFQHAEEMMYTEVAEDLEKKKQKADNATFSGDCADKEVALNNYKKVLIEKKKASLQQAQGGNVYQNQNTQKAYADLQDPIDLVEEAVLGMDVKICKAQKRLANQSGESAQKTQQKINCYNQQKGQYISAKAEMQAINSRYSNNPGQAHLEKMKVMNRIMAGGCN